MLDSDSLKFGNKRTTLLIKGGFPSKVAAFCFSLMATEKEIRNKMYCFVLGIIKKYEPDFVLDDEIRKPIKEIMNEYLLAETKIQPERIKPPREKRESEWKTFPL